MVKNEEIKEELEKLVSETVEEINRIEKEIEDEKKRLREHKKVRHAFLMGKKKILREQKPKEELQEYVLFLMKNNGHIDILEGISPGNFTIEDNKGNLKQIVLSANRIQTINYNKQHFKGWVAHEDNMMAYPQDPIHNAEMQTKIVEKLSLNYREANTEKKIEAGTKRIIAIIAVVGVLLIVLGSMATRYGWFDSGTAEVTKSVVEIAKQNISRSGGVIISG